MSGKKQRRRRPVSPNRRTLTIPEAGEAKTIASTRSRRPATA
jgi:hypothetical protein